MTVVCGIAVMDGRLAVCVGIGMAGAAGIVELGRLGGASGIEVIVAEPVAGLAAIGEPVGAAGIGGGAGAAGTGEGAGAADVVDTGGTTVPGCPDVA
jgi:hypothetical protein